MPRPKGSKNKPKTAKKRRRNKDGTYIDDENGERNPDEEEEDPYNEGNFFGPGNSNGTRNFGNGMNGFNNRGGFR